MSLFAIVLIALGLSADAVAVAIASGFRIRHLTANKALKIALLFGLFQGIMPLLGWVCGLSFRNAIARYDHWFAFLLLGFLGGKTIYEAWQEEDAKPAVNPLQMQTLLLLAIATSIDALATGLGFSVLHISIATAASIIGIVTFVLSFVGVFIGHQFGNACQNQIEILGGAMLIAIGTKILVEHLGFGFV